MNIETKKLLINEKDLENLYQDYTKHNKWISITYWLMGVVISWWISFFLSAGISNDTTKAVVVTIAILVTIVAVIMLIVTIFLKLRQPLITTIRDKAFFDSDWTALFAISSERTYINGATVNEFLVEYTPSKNCEYLLHYKLNRQKTLKEQISTITGDLANQLNVNANEITITEIETVDPFSIKLHSNGLERLFEHVFFNVIITPGGAYNKNQMRHRFANTGNGRKWRSLRYMQKDPKAMLKNIDVLTKLDSIKADVQDSFAHNVNGGIKIIWNITKECGFSCPICATHDDKREELSLSGKKMVLFNILSETQNIRHIDFAGGDPLLNNDSKSIIKHAIDILGESKVSISTTGKGIKNLLEDEKRTLLTNCELTFDSSNKIMQFRQNGEYGYLNERFARENANIYGSLSINIPVLENLQNNEAYLEELIKIINELKVSKVTLLRLMPVGKMKDISSYPNDYNPLSVIDKFRDSINKKTDVHLHCAFRWKYSDGSCNMLTEKVGIDCAGNVFTCAWAGYLNCKPRDNPFYIGNIHEKTLTNILSSKEAEDIKYKMKNKCKHCCVFSYIYSPANDMFKHNDPL